MTRKEITDLEMYYGAASGQQRAALRRLDVSLIMTSYASENNHSLGHDHKWFLDSGGYHHMATGSGSYENADAKYLDFIETHAPDVWALRDYPCEPDLLNALDRTVTTHQKLTLNNHLELMNLSENRDLPGRKVPVLQGWTVNEYLEFYDRLKDQGAMTDYVGIGSICRRGQDREIAEIILSVADELPAGTDIHAFGIKGNVLRFREVVNALTSADSGAYDFATSRGYDGESRFTWRDAAREWLNWTYELRQIIETESLDDPRQSGLDEVLS